ncbi:MAG TPA: fatty acid desaturase [Pirellulales bacterium]|nr:fatty acid desaturase [Pirellulales bacterium]
MLQERRAGYWLRAAAADWSVILASLAAAHVIDRWPGYVVAWLIVGNRQHALSLLGHDGAHRLICRDRAANDWLTCLLSFWPLWTDLEPYRRFHFAHHRHVGTVDDPETGWKGIAPGDDPPLTAMNVVRWFLLDLIGLGAIESGWYFKHYRPSPLGPALFWSGIAFAAYWCGLLWAVLLWHAAFLTSFWAFFRLRAYTEHWGTTGTHRCRPRWWQRAFLPHNTWAHFEHHERPDLPFWALPHYVATRSRHRRAVAEPRLVAGADQRETAAVLRRGREPSPFAIGHRPADKLLLGQRRAEKSLVVHRTNAVETRKIQR